MAACEGCPIAANCPADITEDLADIGEENVRPTELGMDQAALDIMRTDCNGTGVYELAGEMAELNRKHLEELEGIATDTAA